MNGSLQYGAEGNFVPLGQLPKQGGGYGGEVTDNTGVFGC